MSAFALVLQSPLQSQRFDDVTSLTARDGSGSFGVLAGHARMITLAEPGLLRFRRGNGDWAYAAHAGGLLYVLGASVFVCSERFVTGTDYARLSATLAAQLRVEDESLKRQRSTVAQMEEELMRRLWHLNHG